MGLISFKTVKLFKSAGDRPPADPDEDRSAVPNIVQNPFTLIILFSLILAVVLSYIPAAKSLPEPKPGEIASADIVVPADLTVEDTATTESRQREAVAAVLPVYTFDPDVIRAVGNKIRGFFGAGRDWLKASPAPRDYILLQKIAMDKFGLELGVKELGDLERETFSDELEAVLVGLLEKISAPGIILSRSLFIYKEDERGLALVKLREGEQAVRPQDILDVKEAKSRLVAEINALDLSSRRKGLLISLSFGFLAPNVSFNKAETEARQAQAQIEVEKVFYTLKKGRVLVRKGDEATSEAIRQVKIINQTLQVKRPWLAAVLGTFLLFGLLLLTLWFYLRSLLSQRTAFKYFLMMGVTVGLSLIFYKILAALAELLSQNVRVFLFADVESAKYALPYQFGTLLFAFLTSNAVALIFAVLNGLLIGYLFGANYFLMLFSLIGGLAAIYGIKYYKRQKRTSTLRAGFFVVAPTNIFVILTYHLIRQQFAGIGPFAADILMGLTGGLFGAALAFVLLPIYESIFRFVTQTKLLELTNSESEIFRKMAIEAPGSYHHSLIVASLAEPAAEAIKADSLLVKAGALYHDIGKLKMPEYFIENKKRRADVHKGLAPSMSTLVIINHVKEGLEIARKEKLPEPIREIIEQHHGNSLVRYFYQKAQAQANPEMEKVGEETYRYPGPRPQTKEAAVVMLADSVEAASRSLKVRKEENLKRVIKEIFDNYLQDGQLDDCAFSLREMRAIAASFLATLERIYQPRVDYPGFEFEAVPRKKSDKEPRNGKNGNDRGPEPTKEEPH
jgi:putative nucleotidyltransferase with HDIG domain